MHRIISTKLKLEPSVEVGEYFNTQGFNFNFCRNYCMRVDPHESITKHRDFLVCPGTTISSTTKPKLRLKSLDISKQDLQFYERYG